ncbi:hypothetical protein T03_9383 [Trichinella britovi]|nr:hypothetical protein T03_15028 [Trichinella britovi]KRY27181.1 hypothetical protein T03_6310 [Trichinella britovi]KRY27189.1 hypothetical protein T03_12138 [Trichinella britovi]KRY28255.1 hypothetical protein T03_9383 [Trichinella britovi]
MLLISLISEFNVKILNNLFQNSGTLQQHFQFLGYKWH